MWTSYSAPLGVSVFIYTRKQNPRNSEVKEQAAKNVHKDSQIERLHINQ